MASRRVGLNNSETGKAVTKAAGLSNAVFGGTSPQVEEIKKELEEQKEEAKEAAKEEVAKEEPKKEEKPKKEPKKEEPKKEEEEDEKEELIRQTYFLTPVLIESIRILSFQENTKKNEMVRKLLNDAIPGSVIAQAKENVKKFNKKK